MIVNGAEEIIMKMITVTAAAIDVLHHLIVVVIGLDITIDLVHVLIHLADTNFYISSWIIFLTVPGVTIFNTVSFSSHF